MALVYLAYQFDLEREVALKELAGPLAGNPAFAERFLRESRVSGSLSHPNLVTVFDYFEHDAVPYIAMEYLQRGSLRALVSGLTPAQIAGVLEGLLAGLAHAHDLGVVHRDLKPENVLITPDGRVKITDFGVAKAYNTVWTRHHPTATGMTVGTPAYMAPEQAMGGEIGPRTDLYSLGVMAYELVCGQLPFPPREDETPLAVLYRHITEPVPPVETLRPGTDPRLAQWVERLLAKDPGDRPAGAREAWDELEELTIATSGALWRREAPLAASGEPARPPRAGPVPTSTDETRGPPARTPTPAPPAQTRPPRAEPAASPQRARRRRAVLLGSGLALGAAAAAAAVIVFGGDDPGAGAGAKLPAQMPECMRALTAGVPHGSVVVGTSNQPFARAADTRDSPATVIFLEAARPVLAMRVIHRPGAAPPVFELQRSIDTRCRSVAIENRGEGTSRVAGDWAPLRMTLGGRAYQAALNHDTKTGNIEAGMRELATPSLKITDTRRSATGITVEGELAADAGDQLTALYAAPSGARFQGTAKPSGGLFRARIRLPRAEATTPTGRITVTYPGDDDYARSSVTAAL